MREDQKAKHLDIALIDPEAECLTDEPWCVEKLSAVKFTEFSKH